ncbi:MAG: rRNA maturation RNase YbeY [Bacteroidales bacterium]|nr:rRNA maturation RNase YbeY [Bacteroidales bacterium]MDD2324121.1 rRNA maturation RNase YbeY [Bacteroidales bacterium]MDD3010310.1 rRNA maturation RNase YbeY [Bacteroidales bacterium]MDY0286303.1 rRNA maturation RNase YbeY [Bacteroidales bacterium]HPE87178.1 rRNA maturation RNase YbeY [Bacteroidales bacterium]
MRINFFSEEVSYTLKHKRLIRTWLSRLFFEEGVQVDTINYIFCSDHYLYAINVQYLQHETFTDTITFSYNNDNEDVIGDVYISYDRVKENARELRIAAIDEVHRLLVHGALHLCGYNDKTGKEKMIMTQKEDHYLLLFSDLVQ